MPVSKPVVLCILDGVGLGTGDFDDAVATARTPVLDRLMAEYPSRTLKAHGTAVGLPSDGDMGNSEVGHNAMGAGRIFDQGAKLVNAALESGAAFETPVWRDLVATPMLHLLGLCSDGNVHSHIDHLHRLIDRAISDGAKAVRLHLLTDGRDVGARTALTWFEPLERRLAGLRDEGVDIRIASGGGRMQITMDRYEADWEMVARGWRCHVQGLGRAFSSATEAIQTLYDEDPASNDQILPAFVVCDANGPVGPIQTGHGVLFFNFRGDRALEISRAFTEEDFEGFDRGERPHVVYAGMMQYDGDRFIPPDYLVQPPAIDDVMGEHLIAAGLRTFAISETQKFGHVTFFFNGNRSEKLHEDLEQWKQIPSYLESPDTRPWMRAAEVTDAAIEAVLSGDFDHIRMNLANGDMVGHTGHLEATRVALECVDLQLARLEAAVIEAGGILLVTADHGNADEMVQHKGGKVLCGADGVPLVKTSHTLNPVPFILVDPQHRWTLNDSPNAGLANIAATVLTLCGVAPPLSYEPTLVVPETQP